jgi:hypothetical protein
LLVVGAPIWDRAGVTTGVVRDSVPYFLYDREGALVETLGPFPSVEVYRTVTGESWRLTGVPFARAPIVAVGASSFIFGPADSYELREYNLNGNIDRILRIDHAPRSINNDDIAEYRRDRLERAEQEGARPAMERLLSELPFPATLPPYERAVLDEENNLWIADYRVTREGSANWKVFSASGDFMGSVVAPARLERSRMEAKDGSAGFDFEGTYTRVVPHSIIEYRMGDGREARVEFAEQPDGVRVTVTFDAESENPPERQREGWQAILDRFGRHVESTGKHDRTPESSFS